MTLRRRGRRPLAALAVFAAAVMLGTSVTVAYALETGFDRAVGRAGLPDVLARFQPMSPGAIDARVRTLPDLGARSYRREVDNVPLAAGGHSAGDGLLEVLLGGRRGYSVVAGHDLTGAPGEVVVERGLADAWGVRLGDTVDVGELGSQRVVGISVEPDDVAYPLASSPHVYIDNRALVSRFGEGVDTVNTAMVWANDPSHVDQMLVQARSISYGVRDLRFVTRAGVRVLVDEAAGIVIALLAAFSIVALLAAGVMLAASSHAEVQRSLRSLGVERAIGFTRAAVARRYALSAARAALLPAAAGLALGSLAASPAVSKLLSSLNEISPSATAIAVPLLITLVATVAIVAGATAWPAWRAAGRRPAEILRRADISVRGRSPRTGGGFGALGARLVAARRARAAATVAVLGVSLGVVLLMVALASLLTQLENDPTALGRRYQLTANAAPADAASIRRLPGVADAAARYELDAADSFQLGETVKLIAYPVAPSRFENPPLAAGRRVVRGGEAEIGQGLANSLGIAVGGTLAVQLDGGREARFGVVGVDRALQTDGRVAYVFADPAIASNPAASEDIAVRLTPGAAPARVSSELASHGWLASASGGGAPARGGFLGVLAGVLRVVAVVDGAICLYALVQALALTASERRPTIAVLRAHGAGGATLARLFGGAALAVVLPAALLGLLLERYVFGPAVSRLAAGYVSLPLYSTATDVALVAAGVAAIAAAAAVWTGRRAVRQPIVAGLAEA